MNVKVSGMKHTPKCALWPESFVDPETQKTLVRYTYKFSAGFSYVPKVPSYILPLVQKRDVDVPLYVVLVLFILLTVIPIALWIKFEVFRETDKNKDNTDSSINKNK